MKTKYIIYDIYLKQNSSPFSIRNTGDINAVLRQGRTEGDFTLAVCLSVLITFICAFCLGAFTRPYIGSIWRQIRRNRRSTSENTYSNEGFSSESLTRENTANTQASLQQNVSICTGNSSGNAGPYIVEVSSLHKVALHNRVHTLNTEQGNQDQSSNYVQKEKVSLSSRATNSAGEANTDIINKENFSSMLDYQHGNKAFQGELKNDILSCDDSKYFFNEDSGKDRVASVVGSSNLDSYSLHVKSSDLDSSCSRKTTIPFSEAQMQTNGQSSEYNDVDNRPILLRSETAQSLQEKMRQMTSHTQSLNTQQFTPQKSNCDKKLGGSNNVNRLNNSENFTLPPSYEKGINIETSNTCQTQQNSPAYSQEYDCKEENIWNKDNPLDMFNDSSSTNEGAVFTLSDSSSEAEGELELHNPGDDHLANPSATKQMVSLNSDPGKFTTLPQGPNITTRFQNIMGKHENKDETYSETAIISRSGPSMSKTYSSVLHTDVPGIAHIDKFDDHITLSDSNTKNPPCYEVSGMYEYVTSPNSPAQNTLSNSVHKQNISFNNVTLPSVKHSPKSISETENIVSKDTCLQFFEISTLTQHFDRSTPIDQIKNVTEINTEENHITQSTSQRSYGEDGITLNIANTNVPHVNNNFICTSVNFGSNRAASKATLMHSNTANDEPPLQSHSETTDGKSVVNITERQSSVQQHMNMSEICAQKMQKDFNEQECDEQTDKEVLSGIGKTNSILCTDELQFHDTMTNSSPITPSETMPSVFNEENYFQVDYQSEENVCSSNPQSFFNENVQHSLGTVSQNAQGNTIINRTNSSETESETSLAELDNSSRTVAVLQNSSETPDQTNEARRGKLLTEGKFFVKKKRAFDGFASVLQSRTDSTK